ncbi:unnamed protein product [Allacma fusca]|uniref:Acyl-CoA dehydrogenase n=1 Tax=Allacma fusca TaxID=39272 RepID=A0A8J2LB08_9HEXA|nr:unnamed protein product [Allacma fusca]
MFRHAKIGSFWQGQPKLGNTYLNDGFLQRVLKRVLPAEAFADINSDLTRLGARCVTEIQAHGDQVEANQPYLKQYDAWGNRIDQVVTDPSWSKLKDIAAEEGLVSIAYEKKYAEFSRLYQYAKIYLYSPSSGLWSCPLAMTDGAAKIFTDLKLPEFDYPLKRLTTRNPEEFWSSGQWMTERKGGSDVGSGTETIAVPVEGNKYKLYGYKWFTSATDADMTLTLARIQNSNGEITPGSKGLRTRQLPTGELLLEGADASLVSPPGRGVATISGMLSVTRVHNTIASVAAMRRILSLLRDYSTKRECFGEKISNMGLHLNTLAEMEMCTRAGTVFAFELARLFGITETSNSEKEQAIFRMLTPVGKLYFGKLCMKVVSEGVEGFGGNGYIEDTGIPQILRDAQVTPIWEGTTNILSLDVLRAIAKSKGQVLILLNEYILEKLDDSSSGQKLRSLMQDMHEVLVKGKISQTIAREFAFSIAEIAVGALLLQHSNSSFSNKSDQLTTQLWVNRLVPLSTKLSYIVQDTAALSELVYDSYDETI